MKSKIMEKLFNGEELSSEEILFIGRNTPDKEDKGAVQSTPTIIPFHHDEADTLRACGITQDQMEEFCNTINKCVRSLDKGNTSSVVECLESNTEYNPIYRRCMTVHFVKMIEFSNFKRDILGGLLGGSGK